jgi:hypothetical protein
MGKKKNNWGGSPDQSVTGAGAVCDQKILVFVLQMEKKKKKIQAEHVDGVR